MVEPAKHTLASIPAHRYHRPGLRLLLMLLVWLPVLASAQDLEETHIELAASDDQVYVQQQLLVTVRLFYSDNIVRGELSRPEHPDAVIEEAGEQRQYRERRNGVNYRVVERRYAIFPQSPGPFHLPTIEFEGLARHARGHVYRLSDSATLFEIDVRDIPASFSGDTWLPARSLSIAGEGIEPSQVVRPGDNLTRTLRLRAEGLPASVLPPLEHAYPDALRDYPEPANRHASIGAEGVTATLEQTVALVPVPGKGGEVELPAIRIPWWDVTEDREKVAVLPARTLVVAGQPVAASGATQSRPAPTEAETAGSALPEAKASGTLHWGWYAALVAMAAGWGATAMAWWLHVRRRGTTNAGGESRRPARDEKVLFERLETAGQTLDPEFFSLLPRWISAVTGQPCATAGAALAILGSEELSQWVRQWQEHLYDKGRTGAPNSGKLVRLLREARTQMRLRQETGAPGSATPLPRLYPPGLEPG